MEGVIREAECVIKSHVLGAEQAGKDLTDFLWD